MSSSIFLYYTGRIWLEEIAWLLQNDADFEEAAKVNTRVRVTPVELALPGKTANIDKLSSMEGSRIMGTYIYNSFYQDELDKSSPKVSIESYFCEMAAH